MRFAKNLSQWFVEKRSELIYVVDVSKSTCASSQSRNASIWGSCGAAQGAAAHDVFRTQALGAAACSGVLESSRK